MDEFDEGSSEREAVESVAFEVASTIAGLEELLVGNGKADVSFSLDEEDALLFETLYWMDDIVGGNIIGVEFAMMVFSAVTVAVPS